VTIPRKLNLPQSGTETFFLWGPRQTGKTTLLNATYPSAFRVDLLKAEEFRLYLERPEILREEMAACTDLPFVVIDEIQKLPSLLDEVHWLHENAGVRFALCGSSARKVRYGHANLLGGRALRYELQGFVSAELGSQWELDRQLNHGYLPSVYLSASPKKRLEAYVAGYLQEEIAAEGLVRNLPGFSGFLSAAALSDTELVNYSTIARDCGVSSPTIREYFQILLDTLLGKWLPAYSKRPKRRVIKSPKFYFNDVGVVNFLARRGRLERGAELYGKAFENFCFHELNTYALYNDIFCDLSYWRLASGVEVDFIVGDMALAIEAKAVGKITANHLKGIRALKEEFAPIGRAMVVCLEQRPRRTDDGIDIMPVETFCAMLWAGELFREP